MIDWDIWVEHVPFYSQQYIDFIDNVDFVNMYTNCLIMEIHKTDQFFLTNTSKVVAVPKSKII